ncbi:rab11 family-interacting protein 4 [Euwallacea similis]|uniref:rab11 family-interacting protein 4 n=1 Tax=Euwallacea similis TaxID=1736056 RepID=UPI00344F258D
MMSPIHTASVPAEVPKAHFVLTPASSNGSSSNHSNGEQRSQCSSLSDGDNFEWNGEGAGEPKPEGVEVNGGSFEGKFYGAFRSNRSPQNLNRGAWLRSSLRRTTPNNPDSLPNRRWGSFRHNARRAQNLGSNALASQLYRSSSFNSSGRSSTCDTTDDMYSDASLEEDVHDLHHKFQVLQQQVGVLQDSAHQNDERYTRVKAENAALQARVLMLEEQLRDTELRCDEKVQEEQRRSKELIHRVEREKQLQLENASIRLHNSEGECEKLKEEVGRQRLKLEKMEKLREDLTVQNQDLNCELNEARDEAKTVKDRENRLIKEHEQQLHLLEDLSKEIERLKMEHRTPALPTTNHEALRLEELHEEMSQLREQNSHLLEANDELQASLLHAGLETGRILTNGENSLAHELDVMSQDEVHKALKEQQEVNRQLRAYIEGILLNIVENHPQLLEVKHQARNGLKQ